MTFEHFSSTRLNFHPFLYFFFFTLVSFPQALYASKIISYAQGFMLLRQAAIEFSWTLNYGAIALMWRGGCIIRRFVPT